MQDCTHLSRFALVSTVFPMQKRKKVHRLLYHNLCTNVVAGEGFEPTTSGLWLRPALRCPKNRSGLRFSSGFSTAADKTPSLHLPPAARCRLIPTSSARRSHNPENTGAEPSSSSHEENTRPMDGCFLHVVAGEGFEPTTSGL